MSAAFEGQLVELHAQNENRQQLHGTRMINSLFVGRYLSTQKMRSNLDVDSR